MDSQEADKQIKQMIAFIRQEAREKSEEIRQKTAELKTIEKLSYKTNESKLIRLEFEQLRKDKLIKKKIHRSTKITEARFTVMQKRQDLLQNLYSQILAGLCEVSKDPQYGTFIRYCIVEGLTTIMEEQVEVVCRKEDLQIVESQLKPAREEYIKLVERECGVQPPVELRITRKQFLPPHPSPNFKGAVCRGGIVLTACRGKIKLRNTLESRLEQAFEKNKPYTRGMIFGVRPPPANAYKN